MVASVPPLSPSPRHTHTRGGSAHGLSGAPDRGTNAPPRVAAAPPWAEAQLREATNREEAEIWGKRVQGRRTGWLWIFG